MTNVPENTLRAWERRYGFPAASRTAGGHRLYTEYEVQRLQWVKARVDDGMQISQAVRALQIMEEEGRFPESPLPMRAPMYVVENNPTLEQSRNGILDALLDHNTDGADQILVATIASQSLEAVILNVISPVFEDIGQAWAEGHISVATEHFATQRLRTWLLSWVQTSAPPIAVKPVVLACAPGEWHEGSLLMFSVLLRRLRWPITYLGQAVPLPDLLHLVEDVRPSAVVLVAMIEETALELQGLSRWLPELDTRHSTAICFGGRAFTLHPELVEDTPGIYLGDTLEDGVEKLDAMLREMHPGGGKLI
jgi:DNA-binding transcriptional MerR regulator